MKNTKKLLSITNLKKYFPVSSSSLLFKKNLYVRANEDISIDIYEGETLGVVGESGCGKSTFGRVLLKLYEPSGGSIMYYGKTLDEVSPYYAEDTLGNFERYKLRLEKIREKREALDKKIDESGGEELADFYLLQERTLLKSEEQTSFYDMVRILGGFYIKDKDAEGRKLLLSINNANKALKRIKNEYAELKEAYDRLCHISASGKNVNTRLLKIKKRIDEKIKTLEKRESDIMKLRERLELLRGSYAKDEEFLKYEKMRDDGIDISRLKPSEMRRLRKELQIVFQDPYSSLDPRMTVGQIIEEGLLTHGMYKNQRSEMREHIISSMRECGLEAYMLHRYPHQFSGGQRQRVAITRALAVEPKFIVCDECVSALDVSIQSQIINLLKSLKERQNLTYLFISHDLSVVRYISDRICVMYLGNIVELSDAKTLFEDPRHPYTVALLSSIPKVDSDNSNKKRIILEGNIPSPLMPPRGCKFHTRCYMSKEICKRVPPPFEDVGGGHSAACHFAKERKVDENGNYLFDL